jgi:hypothetical protein
MIANTAFGAALTTFLIVAWLAGELAFMAPYKFALFHYHAHLIGGGVLVLFLNLSGIYYSAARWLFLRDTGASSAIWNSSSAPPTPPSTTRSRTFIEEPGACTVI